VAPSGVALGDSACLQVDLEPVFHTHTFETITMRQSIQIPVRPAFERQGARGGAAFLLLAIGIPWGIWNVITLFGGGDPLLIGFNAAAGWFVVLGVTYLGLYGVGDLGWCSAPVLLTLEALLELVVLPVWRFAISEDQVDSFYVRAMVLALIGFIAFWSGSLIFLRGSRIRFVPQENYSSRRLTLVGLTMLFLGFIAKFVLWKFGLLSYLGDQSTKDTGLPYVGFVNAVGNLLPASMALAAIERYGKRSKDPLINFVFWSSLTLSLVVGALSGMKGAFITPLLLVVLTYGVTWRRIHRVAFALPLLIAVIYPFNTAYRNNLNSGYRFQANTLGGMEALLTKTFADMATSPLEQAQSGADRTTGRLSNLTFIHDIISLPAPSLLNGNEKLWMAPVYPFIPRILWQGKPVFDKGTRLSVALGRPDTTSSAVTPIGDLYMLNGVTGIVIGMFVYGTCFQIYMNFAARRPLSEKGLLVYLSLLVPLMNFESDVVAEISSVVQAAVSILVASYLIYGPSVPLFTSQPRLDSSRQR
jgi:hypothetical protein